MRRGSRVVVLFWLGIVALGRAPIGCASGVSRQGSTSAGEGAGGSGGSGGEGGAGHCFDADDCAAFSDSCNVGTCINAVCQKVPANESGACDDGKQCTTADHCEAGLCTGPLQACNAMMPCHVGYCDVATDACIEVAGNDGAGCVDDDPCALTSVCQGGSCVGAQPIDCSFLDTPCGFGACDSAVGCVAQAMNDGTSCDDGLFCTDQDVCGGAVCAGKPKACAQPNNACLTGTCNEVNNLCVTTIGNEGLACDDGNLCTQGETCTAGVCGGGAPANGGFACDDGDGCTSGTTCQGGLCANAASTISSCVDADACCPANCPNDSDCPLKVLLVVADDPVFSADVKAKLTALGEFSQVDLFDVDFDTPTLAVLSPYQAVLVYSGYPFFDPSALGDVLADYYDGGGRVVLAPGANCLNFELGGRFVSDGYMVLGIGGVDPAFPFDALGVVAEPNSPLIAGVGAMSSQKSVQCLGSPLAGATVVASWAGGRPLIVRGVVGGRNRVDLNLFPPSDAAAAGFWVGDGARILAIALKF
jgi:hypothetical protein